MIKKLAEEFKKQIRPGGVIYTDDPKKDLIDLFVDYLDKIGLFMLKECDKCGKDRELVYKNEKPIWYHCFECYPVPTKKELEKMK